MSRATLVPALMSNLPCCAAEPSAELKAAIDEAFGSLDEFKKQFKAAGATQFGSGWAWLVKGKDGKLAVTKTPNAENPLVHGQTPLLTMDVWEHAYYLDVQVDNPSCSLPCKSGFRKQTSLAIQFYCNPHILNSVLPTILFCFCAEQEARLH